MSLLVLRYSAWANDIHIDRAGDSLDPDIVQDGQNNVIGTYQMWILMVMI